jgi:hypothetical protein
MIWSIVVTGHLMVAHVKNIEKMKGKGREPVSGICSLALNHQAVTGLM